MSTQVHRYRIPSGYLREYVFYDGSKRYALQMWQLPEGRLTKEEFDALFQFAEEDE